MVCSRLMILVTILAAVEGCNPLVAVDNCSTTQETFLAQPKKKKRMTTQQTKRALGDELEQLAHQLLQEINLLTQAEHELLLRISELLSDDVSGLSSSTAGKDIEVALQEVQSYRKGSQQRCQELAKFNHFLSKKGAMPRG